MAGRHPGPGRDAQAAGPADRLRIARGAAAIGVVLDEQALAELTTYLALLESWNARLNLVGEHDAVALIDRHLVDSLAAALVLQEIGAGARIADLGSGAGLPGVPLAIALRPAEMALVEPRRKRASFLRAVQRALPALGLRVVEEHAEALAEREPGTFDAVVSRAALADDALLPLAATLLREDGVLVSYRGVGPPPAGPDHHAMGDVRTREYRLDARRRPFQLHVRRRLRST